MASRRESSKSCVALVLLLAVSGCGYTHLKSTLPSTYHREARQVVSSWKLGSLCNTWAGVIVTKLNGTPVSVDSIYAITIYPDSIWELENERGVFTGQWSFSDSEIDKPEFSFSIRTNTTDRELNKSFIGYFRDWGLQLYSTYDGPHMINVEWDLTR